MIYSVLTADSWSLAFFCSSTQCS